MDDFYVDPHDCIAHDYSVVDSDGRQVCAVCGYVMPRWQDPEDCMDCGVCESCVERTIGSGFLLCGFDADETAGEE